ncbi:Ribonuclease E inhibitor RraA/Dimethylmenaquinone methyltransferase [Phaffia rhodozyma]|uniref:Ribonuclease E inhibitor RraA/Dimethylmenaquinone methyltransferase n=1 Tax=Phaffia rhodozyma TaxID=264483 RepID=A0A0F7SU78_PHARH|nr:Ribonuclease E inhibitor RraA/Dimethylmenaquinone methyltransferase [Phaffia rhodozyma]
MDPSSAADSIRPGGGSLSLQDFSTCEISDALLSLGVASGGFLPDLKAYSPASSDVSSHTRLFGPAYTVRTVPFDSDTKPSFAGHFVDLAPSGSVLVLKSPKDSVNASWGGLMTVGAKAKGVEGVIILGRVRDLEEHKRESFPVYAYSASTLPQKPFTRPCAIQEPLVLSAPHLPEPSTITINPGDWIIADENGVVVVPKSMDRDVSLEAEKRRLIDDACERDIRAGKGVEATFKRWRG